MKSDSPEFCAAVAALLARLTEAGWVESSFFDGREIVLVWTKKGDRWRAALPALTADFADGLSAQELELLGFMALCGHYDGEPPSPSGGGAPGSP